MNIEYGYWIAQLMFLFLTVTQQYFVLKEQHGVTIETIYMSVCKNIKENI